jgi:hypothetical protein
MQEVICDCEGRQTRDDETDAMGAHYCSKYG